MLKRNVLITLGGIAAIAAPIAAVSCNMSVNYKPTILNYEDYMYERGMDRLNQDFNYKTFGDLPEMEQALMDGRTIGGVGSDYYNAKWAAKGYIKKIDFHRALHISYANKSELKTKLQQGYTAQAWKQMESFNSYLAQKKVDVDNDGVIDELWEFMIPYFMQSKVLTFNMKRGTTDWYNKVKGITTQAGIDALFPDKSYLGLLKTLHDNGYNNFVVNDYARDNLMIGSELSGKFTGKVTTDNYKNHVDGFVNTIKQGMNLNINNGEEVIFESSGVGSLDHLVNPKENWGASFLYNGDALYAHYGGSSETDEGENIRTVEPTNPVFLLDGLVLAANAGETMENMFYNSTYEAFNKGWSGTLDTNFAAPATYGDELPPAAANFDSVNYTTPFSDVYNHFQKGGNNDYFAGEDPTSYDVFGEQIFHVATETKMGQDTIIYPISDDLQYKFKNYYISKTT